MVQIEVLEEREATIRLMAAAGFKLAQTSDRIWFSGKTERRAGFAALNRRWLRR